MRRPSDYVDGNEGRGVDDDARPAQPSGVGVTQPKLGPVGYLRFFWRQLTSMRTALLLLLLLAVAAVPGSLFPQRSSDPNGVVQYEQQYPDRFEWMDRLSLFDVYSSPWFSAVYLLLFVSLIGCIVPRTKHHWQALRARPPKTPVRLQRLVGYREVASGASIPDAVESAYALLKKQGYRVERYTSKRSDVPDSVSAERGYLRETGNLVFHTALVGILLAVGVLGGFGYTGQKVIVQDSSFTNNLGGYDSFTRGRFFSETMLNPYTIRLDDFDAVYQLDPQTGMPQATDFTASVTTRLQDGTESSDEIKVNHPLSVGDTNVYLLGNGFAPVVTVRDADGNEVFRQAVPFLPQDANLTSNGVVKIPDGLGEQIGMIGFFYPFAQELESGAYTSIWPDPDEPLLTFNVYEGDLGLDAGVSTNAYQLDTDDMTEIAGRNSDVAGLQLRLGDTVDLPNGLGTVSFEGLQRFVSLDIHHDPTQGWVLFFSLFVVAGLVTGLFVPRRRVWITATADPDGGTTLAYAGLARGEDPGLERAVADLATKHSGALKPRM